MNYNHKHVYINTCYSIDLGKSNKGRLKHTRINTMYSSKILYLAFYTFDQWRIKNEALLLNNKNDRFTLQFGVFNLSYFRYMKCWFVIDSDLWIANTYSFNKYILDFVCIKPNKQLMICLNIFNNSAWILNYIYIFKRSIKLEG